VVGDLETGFSADSGFRLLFALLPSGKRTKKLMKIQAATLLIICMEIMFKTAGEGADLLRNLQKRPCAKACGKAGGNQRISGGGLAENSSSVTAATAVEVV
jgi:hypothetical protein